MSISTTEGDIKLFQPLDKINWADIAFSEDDPTALLLDNGLENYILISLNTDKRADDSETLPSNSNERLGWWGDVFEDVNIGSKLWLRRRNKLTQDIFAILKKDIEESLQWMIDDGIVESFTITVARDTREGAPSNNVIIQIAAVQLNAGQTGFGYYFNWQNQVFERM